mgnify:CR=1 FL=1
MGFYGSNLGDRLIDETLFPIEVKLFLEAEKKLLEKIIKPFNTLIEVGCMYGRYLQWANDNVQNYIGIDIIKSYVKIGQKNSKIHSNKLSNCFFILGNAENLDTILNWKKLNLDPNKTLIFFPFNSFGNMQNYLSVIQSLKKTATSFFISSYTTNKAATLSRQKYYQACNYSNLKEEKNEEGVVFSSTDGLRTMAYHQKFLVESFKEQGLKIDTTFFGNIGIAYLFLENKY